MTLQIKEGGYYRTRDGQKVGPMTRNTEGRHTYTHPWRAEYYTYTDGGKWGIKEQGDSESDIVAEWVDTPQYAASIRIGLNLDEHVRSWVDKVFPAAPILWKDMTPEQKGALLLAHHEGKVIEAVDPVNPADSWSEIHPSWCDDYAYRVAPEPKRETVALCWRNDGPTVKNRIGTIDLIDGKPDFTSIVTEIQE